MPSTYSSNLKIELIAVGEQDGTWGVTTNTNLGTALEQAITGTGTVTFASADVTLAFASSNASQDFRNIRLLLDGTTGGARNLIVPNIQKLYLIDNTTADTVTVKTTAGTGIAVPASTKVMVYADGVNVVDVVTHINSLTANSPIFTGTAIAPTPLSGANNTQIATTAFVNSEISAGLSTLGTISTQNANNVAITGGSITGITDLAVADGGTGASDAAGARASLDVPTRTGGDASGTWGIDISGNATTATTANNVNGVGQTWQDLTSSRAFNGTVYSNTTGRPIMVNPAWYNVNKAGHLLEARPIGSGTWIKVGRAGDRDFGGQNTISAIIPNNWEYRVTTFGDTWSNLWSELR